MIDVILLGLIPIITYIGAYIYTAIKRGEIHFLFILVPGFLCTILWAVLFKFSKMSLVNASAWFDAISALGYFTAFAFFGEHISGLQWLGIALLITGLYLINL